MKTIRKYAWQFVSTILAIIAILAAYHRLFISRPTKALQVTVDPPVSLVDIRPEAAQDIEVFYRGESVSNISLLQAHIRNSGNQPITEDDYSRPLSFSFAPDSNLADVAITKSDPSNIGMVISQTSEYRAEAAPILINPGDNVTVRFVVIGGHSDSILEDFEVDGRIAGVKEIELVSPSEQRPRSPQYTVALMIMGAVATLVISLIQDVGRRLAKTIRDRLSRFLSARSTSGQEPLPHKEPTVVFHDTFDTFADWQQYRNGNISQSTDISPHTGTLCLKKDSNNDPNGGFKKIGRSIGLGFVFSGWVYSPAKRAGGQSDRLAIEDSDFNGYGFSVNHDSNTVWIERRDKGEARVSVSKVSFDPPTDQWYQFKLYVKAGGRLELRLCDSAGKELLNVPSVSDEQYSSFNRVAVHGGFPYYVDELKIQTL